MQNHAAGADAGQRRLVLVVGPAGTGKMAAMALAAARLHAQGRPASVSDLRAAAAEVLAVDTGIDADTLDKLLIEHRLARPPRHRDDLPAGSTVIVDEAAMVPTPRLAELIDLADHKDWRLALVGDPMQFAAAGSSGMFGHLVDTIGAVELDRVHRFDASWERDASLPGGLYPRTHAWKRIRPASSFWPRRSVLRCQEEHREAWTDTRAPDTSTASRRSRSMAA